MRTVSSTGQRDKHLPILLVTALFAIGIIAGLFVRHEVVGRNVYAFGVPLGGLSRTEAMQVVQDKVRQLEAGSFTFAAAGRSDRKSVV